MLHDWLKNWGSGACAPYLSHLWEKKWLCSWVSRSLCHRYFLFFTLVLLDLSYLYIRPTHWTSTLLRLNPFRQAFKMENVIRIAIQLYDFRVCAIVKFRKANRARFGLIRRFLIVSGFAFNNLENFLGIIVLLLAICLLLLLLVKILEERDEVPQRFH